jgi:hypothetical protein
LIAAFVAVTVAGPRRVYTGLPYETQNRDLINAETTTGDSCCQEFRSNTIHQNQEGRHGYSISHSMKNWDDRLESLEKSHILELQILGD